MAITFTNIVKDKILEPIRTFIRTEFQGMADVYIGEAYEKRGNISIRLECLNQSLADEGAHGFENQYTVQITYYLLGSNFATKKVMDKVYNDVSRLEQLLFNKSDPVNRSDDGCFYGGVVNSVNYNQKTADELEVDSLITAKIDYLCYYTKMN